MDDTGRTRCAALRVVWCGHDGNPQAGLRRRLLPAAVSGVKGLPAGDADTIRTIREGRTRWRTYLHCALLASALLGQGNCVDSVYVTKPLGSRSWRLGKILSMTRAWKTLQRGRGNPETSPAGRSRGRGSGRLPGGRSFELGVQSPLQFSVPDSIRPAEIEAAFVVAPVA